MKGGAAGAGLRGDGVMDVGGSGWSRGESDNGNIRNFLD